MILYMIIITIKLIVLTTHNLNFNLAKQFFNRLCSLYSLLQFYLVYLNKKQLKLWCCEYRRFTKTRIKMHVKLLRCQHLDLV